MKFQLNKKILLMVSLFLIAAAGIWAVYSIRHLPRYDYSIDDWKGEHTVYRDNGFSVSDDIRDGQKPVQLLWGPYKPLKKGSYTANIRYSADADQKVIATASGSEAELFDSSVGTLPGKFQSVLYQFEVLDDVDEFQLVIRYSGSGDFTVRSISVSANSNQTKRIAATISAVILLIDGIIILTGRPEKERRTVLILGGITALVSLPLAIHGIPDGHDLGVHYLRIESVVDALRSGQFPARISTVALYGLGYPFSIYYNDLFLYFPALLRLLGFSVDSAYKIYVIAFNALTVLISYISFRQIFKSRRTALILSLLYASAPYRMVNIFVRGAVGEYSAQAFLPLLALAFYKIYFNGAKGFRDIFRNALLLAFAMSLIIGVHVLTTIMSCFILLFVLLFFIRKTFSRPVLLTFLLAVPLFLVLNLYFIVPFVDYYFNVPTLIRNFVNNDNAMIRNLGVFPAQFFAFFQNMAGSIELNVDERMQMTPGLPLMGMLLAACCLRIFKKRGRGFAFSLLFSLFTLWLSSTVFPWNWLLIHFPPWQYMIQIQFPYRFLGIAILFLTLLAGCVLKEEELPYIRPAAVGSAVIMFFWITSNLLDSGNITYIYDSSGVVPNATGLEYLLEGSKRENITTDVYSTDMEEVNILSRDSRRMDLYCRSRQDAASGTVDVPLYAYKGYHVTDEAGKEYPYYPGEENRINFELPAGFDGRVTIIFRDPVSWRIALWVSLIAAVSLGAAAYKLRKH